MLVYFSLHNIINEIHVYITVYTGKNKYVDLLSAVMDARKEDTRFDVFN